MGRNIFCLGVKRRQANSLSNQNRQKVNIPNDTWLEALKFLTCSEWSQKCFVCRQISRIVQCNVSRLPKMVLENADMYYAYDITHTKKLKKLLSNYTIGAVDTVLQKKQSAQWFKERGFILDAPVDIPAGIALIGANEWDRTYRSNVNVCLQGTTREWYERVRIPITIKMRLPWFNYWHTSTYWCFYHWLPYLSGSKYCIPMFYYAQFNPVLDKYSWNYLAQFLIFIYHPMTYIKSIKMFAVNQDFIDFLKCNIDRLDNEPCYIRCVSFLLKGTWDATDTNTVDFSNSLKWMERNVRAEKIHISWLRSNESFVLFANFLFDPSGAKQCANKRIKIDTIEKEALLNMLIQKFHKTPLIESAIPTIKLSCFRELPQHFGPNLIDQEVDSQGADALYMISNGQNRMRISFIRAYFSRFNCKVRIYSF